jgi:hypothetical protein
MRTIFVFLMLVCLSAVAAQPPQSVDTLKQRIEQSSPTDQIKLSIEVARAQLQHMIDLYNANDNDNARKALQDVETYAVRAANKAAEIGKHQKDTEIAVRKLSTRLGEIEKDADFDERPAIKTAIAKLDKAHDDLLASMFKKK